MRRSEDRILTTHTGSLPRPPDLLGDRVGRDRGEAVDDAALDERVRAAVAEIVRSRSTPASTSSTTARWASSATRPTSSDRLDGLRRRGRRRRVTADMLDFPECASAASTTGADRARRPPATARSPGTTSTRSAPTSPTSRPRSTAADVEDVFMTRRLAGRRRALPRQPATTRPRGVPVRARRRDAPRVRGDRRRRLHPAARLPRPRDEPPRSQFADLTLDGVPQGRAAARRRAQPRDQATSRAERMRMHLCWGNYEGPHHHDVPLREIVDLVLEAQAAGGLLRGGQPAPRARMARLRAT